MQNKVAAQRSDTSNIQELSPLSLVIYFKNKLLFFKGHFVIFRDFPGGPVVKTSLFSAEGVCLIPHASWPKKSKHKNQKQFCNKFNKEFKNGPHFKKP